MHLRITHVGLVCRSEKSSDRFYSTLLGLKKIGTRTVPADLVGQIFNRHEELKIINYVDDDTHFEIFLDPQVSCNDAKIAHVCIEIEDLDALVTKCVQMKIAHIRVAKPGGWLTFIRDDDGNLFEIKEK